MVTLYYLMNYVCDGNVSMEKSFLMLGGIRNGIYYFNLGNYKVIGTGGAEEINCPGIFDVLHIDYECLEPQQFVNRIDSENLEMDKYFYVVPVLPELLNKSVNDLTKIGSFGQSFFMLDKIEDGKIYFRFDVQETYLDMDILRLLNTKENWVIESEFNIYKISKEKLKENTFINRMNKISMEKLLMHSLQRFTKHSKISGDYGTVRIDGVNVYQDVCDHFTNMKIYLEKLSSDKEIKCFVNYIYIQCTHFRKFILSGTDAYYRNEFRYILEELYGERVEFAQNLKEWEELEILWRNFGRKLSKYKTYKSIMNNTKQYLDTVIDFWRSIGDKELSVVKECKELVKNTIASERIQ